MLFSCSLVLVFLILIVLVYLNNQMFVTSIQTIQTMKNIQKEPVERKTYTSVIVIHTSSPTYYQIERYKEWFNSKSSDYYVAIVTDKCELKNNVTIIPISCYTQEQFMNELPQLKTMTGLCTDKWPVYYMWTSSIEHVIIGMKNIDIDYKYLWLIEQDLGYTGNFFDFFRKYDAYDYDLIGQQYMDQFSNATWMWFDCSTPEYTEWKNKVMPNKRVDSQINIARMSKKLIESITLNIKMKRHTFSEATMIENAMINNLTVKVIDKEDFGEICSVYDKIPLEDWIKIQNDPAKKNKIYHALKF